MPGTQKHRSLDAYFLSNEHFKLLLAKRSMPIQPPSRSTYKTALSAVLLTILSPALFGDTGDQAKRIHERLTGVPPTEAVLLEMITEIEAGDTTAAANIAMENPAFYNVTLKNWATPWTNRDFDVFQPLNDYSATVIGLIRDDKDFRDILSGDVAYTGAGRLGLPPYSTTNNDHYEALEDQNIDMSNTNNLVEVTQSSLNGLPTGATAGVMTSRAAAKSFFVLGTNRAMFRFTLINHLCTDLEQLNDTARAPDRIRQDVSRSPGGDSRAFLNNCLGCHAGMDPMAQAFAYYNYDFDTDTDPDAVSGRITYNNAGTIDAETGTRVVAKYHINSSTFPYGYVTPDDTWDNYWREGQNQSLGWDQTLNGSGSGAKSLGEELAATTAFAQCQVEKAFELVCLRPPSNEQDRSRVTILVDDFQSSGYNMKRVFAGSADYCKGE